MVVPDITNPFFPAVVKAVEDALHSSGISLFLCDANDSPEIEADRLAALLARNVDAIIISPVDAVKSRPAVAAAAKRVNLVQVDRYVAVDTDIVLFDDSRGIQMVVEHLASQGCASFAFVTTTKRSSMAMERLEAYVRSVRPIDRVSARRVLAGDLTIAWGAEAGARLSADGCPEAVVCANDLIALGVLRSFSRLGIRVPDDVAVTGYDNLALAEVVEPGLTSVAPPLEPLGREAVRFATSPRDSPGSSCRTLLLIPELIVRDSTARQSPHQSRAHEGGARLRGILPPAPREREADLSATSPAERRRRA
jgi:LacI family transcriptional regulator